MTRALTLCLAMVLGTGVPAASQEVADSTARFTLTGEVRDASTNRPILAAVIKVPDLERVAYSDLDGTFEIPDFPVGTWDIVVEQLGYHTSDASVTVVEGNGLAIRLVPDPLALRGFEVRARSERLLHERRRTIPFRVATISPQVLEKAAHMDPTTLFRAHAGTAIIGCDGGLEEAMTPGCMPFRGSVVRIAVTVDEGDLLGGMDELSRHNMDEIHSMEWIPRLRMLRVYTRDFIRRLDETRISLEPLIVF